MRLANCRISVATAWKTLNRHALVKAASSTLKQDDVAERNLRTDSRALLQKDIFLAYKGVSSDGHAHIASVETRCPGLLVVEDPSFISPTSKTPWIAVSNGRLAWSYLASEAFGNPGDSLTLLGVTGTNGKSSTVWMIGELLKACGHPCLTIGTLGAYFGDRYFKTSHTTPDPDVLYSLLSEAVKAGIKTVAMEVSSHAICQEKVAPLRYAAAGFTSFTRDHLDFHLSMEDYWVAKWRLFSELSRPDARHVFWSGLASAKGAPEPEGTQTPVVDAWVYGRNEPRAPLFAGAKNALQLAINASGIRGSNITLKLGQEEYRGDTPYFAQHALENFAAAFLLASRAAGFDLGPNFWRFLKPVPGRLEQVVATAKKPKPHVVVDYAHTPDALEKTLQVLRPFCPGRLVVVFGCGGQRDAGKRPEMGRIAEALADQVCVTSDNPRAEDPENIIRDILTGLAHPERAIAIADREKAIAHALAIANSNDLVLIAGKGHETYQLIGERALEFDDRLVAESYLRD